MREAFLTGTEEQLSEQSAELTVVPEREIVLSKVKLDKYFNLYAEYTLRENGVGSDVTRKVHQRAHEDLVNAFKKLTVHLCLMTEVVEGIKSGEDEYLPYGSLTQAFMSEDIYSAPEFDTYRCTGFTLTSGGVVLVGQKKLRSKKVLNLVTPFEVLEPETPTGDEYYYLPDLDHDLSKALDEVKLYLDGKYNDDGRQLDMFEEVHPEELLTGQSSPATELGYTVSVREKSSEHKDVTQNFEQMTRTFGGKEMADE